MTYYTWLYKSFALLFSDACFCGRLRRNSISTLTQCHGWITAPSLSSMSVLRGYDEEKRNTQVHNAWRRQLTYPSTEFDNSIIFEKTTTRNRKMFPTSNRIRKRALKTVKQTEWSFNFGIMEITTSTCMRYTS